MICPYCHNEHPDTAQFCPTTGQRLVLPEYCQNCGNKMELGWRVCGYCGQVLPGQSAPGNQSGVSIPAYSVPGAYPGYAPAKRWRLSGCLLGGAIGLVVLVGIILIIDALTLHGVGRLTGRYDGAAAALPADSIAYVGINFLNATPQKLQRVSAPFSQTSLQTGKPTDSLPRQALVLANPPQQQGNTDPISQLILQIQDEFELTIPDDLIPWAGQFGGLALVSNEFNPDAVVAIEVRSPGKADSFLRQWAARLKESKGLEFSQDSYRGVTIYVSDSNYQNIAFCRSGWTVLVATDGEALRNTIDQQQQGNTLMKDDTFRSLLRQAPAGRTVTVYISENFSALLFDENDPEMAIWNPLANLLGIELYNQPILAALSIVEEGMQLDVFSGNEKGKLKASMVELLESFKDFSPRTAAYFPEDTQLFYTTPGVGVSLDRLFDTLGDGDPNGREFVYQSLDASFGFRPDRDFRSAGGQDWAIGINHMAESDTLGGLGDIYLAVEIQDLDAVKQLADRMAASIEGTGGFIDQRSSDQAGYYQAGSPPSNEQLFSYGFSPQVMLFTLGGSMADLEAILDKEQSLEKNPRFSQAWKALPGNITPILFMDVEAIYQNFKSSIGNDDLGEIRYMEPIERIAAAIHVDGDYQTHLRLVAFIKQP